MYAILTQTRETIEIKKKESENNQNHINAMALEMASLVNKNNNINIQVEQLESELYRVEKQVLYEESLKRSVSSNDECMVKSKEISRQ